MQFMVMMIPAVYQPGKKIDPNFVPPAEAMERMGRFNDELQKAGALESLNGLTPLQSGARVRFSGGKTSVTDGPYIDTKDVIGGYWILNFKSKAEAVEWMKRCPADDGDTIEIRPIFEMPS